MSESKKASNFFKDMREEISQERGQALEDNVGEAQVDDEDGQVWAALRQAQGASLAACLAAAAV